MADSPNPDAQLTEQGKGERAARLILFLVVFIDLLGFGIVLPLLPLFGERFILPLTGSVPGADGEPTLPPLGGMILGLLMASFSAMQFLFAPVWGRISDRVGRRPILLLGLIGSVIFYCVFGTASDLSGEQAQLALALLFIARLGAGIAGATISTAQAVIADTTSPEKRRSGMALIGAAFGIGFTFGPLVGFATLNFAPDWLGGLGYVAAGLSLLALVLAIWLLPETRRIGGPGAKRIWFDWDGLQTILRTHSVGLLVLIYFLASFGFGAFEVTLALLNKDTLGLRERDNFLVFAFVGLVLLLTQGVLYRRLAKRLHELAFTTMGIIFMGLGVAGLGVANLLHSVGGLGYSALLTVILLSLTVAVVGFAFLTPSVQSLISRRSDPERQGEVLGVNQSASALARILGPFIGLTLYGLDPRHLLPYAFGAVLLLVMLPLIPRLHRTAPPDPASAA